MRSEPVLRPLLVTVLSAVLPACLPDAPMKIGYNDTPREIGDGWSIAAPEDEGFDPDALRSAYELLFDENEYVTAISLLVVRHGHLVAEGYCRSLDDITRLNALQSATKSVTSILTGMAIADGYVSGAEERLYAIIPDKFDADPAKRELTVSDALTMRTGIGFDNDSYSRELLIDGHRDSLAYILAKPLITEPGTEFDYIDASPHLLAGALQRAVGTTLEAYARRRLFEPLGIERVLWEAYPDGITLGAVGLYLTPRDMARIGQLMLQQGSWQGEELLPAAWVAESTEGFVETDMTAEHGYLYGYYWWAIPSLGAYTADGHGGQYIFVAPDLDLVIVMTAEPHTSIERGSINLDDFEPLAARIVNAVVE